MGDDLKPPSFIHTSLERTHNNIQRFEQNCELLKADLYKFALIPWSPGFQAVCEITRDPILHPAYCRCDQTVFDISSAPINGDGIPLIKLSNVPTCEISPKNIIPLDQPVKSVANAKVTVVFDSCENASAWQGNIDAFADVLSSALTLNLFIVTEHCLVDLEGFAFCGIKYLIFHCNKLNGGCGSITRSTKIIVKSVTDYPAYLRLTANQQLELAPGLGTIFERMNGLVQDFVKGKHKLKLSKLFVNGPSGCGKTVLVDQVCQRNNLHVVLISGGNCAESKPGEAERKLREAFSSAKCSPNGIVVIDQIDSLCPKIRDTTPSHTRRLVKQLALLLDQAKSILVVGLSSRPTDVDPSILRAGRLENNLVIAPPTEGERKLMLVSLFKPFAQDLDKMQELCLVAARLTPGYIMADLSLLVRETALEVSRGTDRNWLKSVYSTLAKMKPATLRGGLGVVTTDPMSMDQIGGLTDIKMKLKAVIEWPLLYPSAFQRMGIPRPKGVLLYGPPGCAKTSLVKAIASMIGTSFLAVSAAELYSSLVGDSEKSLAALFQRARSAAPAVLFIDEIDALVGQRGDSQVQTGVQERVLATVLVEMDGLTVPVSGGGVLVVAATNRPDLVDAALLRPGRFDQMIHVPAPDLDSRVSILKTITSSMSVADDLDLNEIGSNTELFSGADLQQLCKEAALRALTIDGMQVAEVKKCHFSKILETMKPSLSQNQLHWYKAYRTGQGHSQ